VLIGLGFAAIALFGGDAVAVPAVGDQPREQAVSQLKDAGFQAETPNQRSRGLQIRADGGVGYLSYITDGAWAVYAPAGLSLVGSARCRPGSLATRAGDASS
jgi:hypothetical protein